MHHVKPLSLLTDDEIVALAQAAAERGEDEGEANPFDADADKARTFRFAFLKHEAALMDTCGNHAPLLWMLNARGFDLASLRRRESETEKMLRVEREARMKAEERVRYFEDVMTGRRATA